MPRFELAAREAAAAGARSAIWGGALVDGAGGGAPAIHRRLAPFAPFASFLERKGVGRSGRIFFFFSRRKKKNLRGPPGLWVAPKGANPARLARRAPAASPPSSPARTPPAHPHARPQSPIRPAPRPRALCAAHRVPPRGLGAAAGAAQRSQPSSGCSSQAPHRRAGQCSARCGCGLCACLTPAARTSGTSGRSRRELRHPVHAARPAVHHHVHTS